MPAQTFRVVRFLVHAEPVWRFDDLVTLAPDTAGCSRIGDARVEACDEGWLVSLAVRPFRDLRIAEDAYGTKWRQKAVAALMAHFRQQPPAGSPQLYRDPIDGTVRNLAD